MGVSTSPEAIECAYRDYGAQLWRGVYAFSGGRSDMADDAVAEAFARALEGTTRIRSLLPWLYRVAFRHAAARLRHERRQRAVVFLFYYADLSIADIARATGSSRVAVRVQLHRAREALRRRYGSAAAMRAWSSTGGTDERELV